MSARRTLAGLLAVVAATACLGSACRSGLELDEPVAASRAWWPGWRGPTSRGIAPDARPPIRWSTDEHVRWSSALPGDGHASPVIHGDTVFVSYAEPFGEAVEIAEHPAGAHDNINSLRRLRLGVIALDRHDGRERWRRVVGEAMPHEGIHVTGSWASASPVTDGRRVYAGFGSYGLFALDATDGATLWHVDPGPMRIRHGHGEGSGPTLHADRVVLQHDHEGDSFLAAFDAASGEPVWRTPRSEGTSWSTPIVLPPRAAGEPAVVVTAATPAVRGYDLADGRELWRIDGLSRNVVASPVAAGSMLFAGSSYDTRALLGIRFDDGGEPEVVWSRDRDTPYVPSPVLLDDALCYMKHLHPVLTCVDPRTGAIRLGPWRVPGLGRVFASPVAAAGRLYVSDLDGVTAVVALDDPPRVLARNPLDDSFSASAALADDAIFLRGKNKLWCLAAP